MKKLYEAFLTFSRGKQIAIAVCLVHLLAVFALFGHHLFSRRIQPVRPIVVRTITPIPVVAAPPKPEPVKQKEAAPAKKESAAKPKGKAVAKKQEPVKKEVVEAPKAKKRPALVVPAKIETKAPVIESEIDPNYGEFLIAFLQNSLDLPEYGEVKARLEIDRFGKLVKCEIIDAKSTKNAEFLKAQLPELLFPYLNDFGIVDSTQTFTITFRNVENR